MLAEVARLSISDLFGSWYAAVIREAGMIVAAVYTAVEPGMAFVASRAKRDFFPRKIFQARAAFPTFH